MPLKPSATAHAVPVVLVARVACPSYQSPPGHHIDRSATTGTVDVIAIETEVAASAGSTCSTGIVRRCSAGMSKSRCTGGAPDGSWNVTWIRAGVGDGLATCTNVSKNAPVAPSARNQLVPSVVTPVPSMPAVHSSVPRLLYIARSTMIGVPFVLWNSPATSAASSPGMKSALIVRRWCAPTV